jgi:hypothetical protein
MISENIYKYNDPIFTEIAEKTSVKIIIKFISSYITELPNICNKKKIVDEDSITQELIILLNRKKYKYDYPFYFHPQFIQEENHKRKIDFGTILTDGYSDSNSIFDIECKRLPTPGFGREKEYVQKEEEGKGHHIKESGAMARFKKSIYSKNLLLCSIIGYVQKDNFKKWFDRINNWIIDFSGIENSIWNNEDTLYEFTENDKVAFCLSNNQRQDKSKIKIHHIWIMMN